MATGYLVVKITDHPNKKNIGCKCIPASWAKNPLRDNYSIIRYPEEETSETRVQVENQEPPVKTWPFYCVLIMFRTDSYEKAIEFIAENDRKDSPAKMYQQDDTAVDEQPDNTMNNIKTSASATPSTSGKRRQSENTYNNTTNESSPPKKKRKSAIHSGNNLKMLIQNKLLHYNPKQKVCPKKILSFNAGKFNKLEKLYTETVAAESRGSTTNDDITATDGSDSNTGLDTIPPPERNILKPALISGTNATNKTKNAGRSRTPSRETIIAIEDSDSSHEPGTIHPPERNILKPALISGTNATDKTKNAGRSKTPSRETTIAIEDSDSSHEPGTLYPPERNILKPALISGTNATDKTKNAGRSKTPSRETTIAIEDSDSSHEPGTLHPPERYRRELVHDNEPNPTNTTNNSGKSKTSLPDPTQISHTNNLDQQKVSNTNFKGIQSSLNAKISALQNRMQHLAPENGPEHQNIADIKHIEDIYNSILELKSKMIALYTEESKQLKKKFESINLFVPDLKKGLSLPTIEQLKENSRPSSDKLKTVSSRQEQPSQKKGPSTHLRTPYPQQSESSSDSEYFSQSPKPSTSSKSRCYCSHVAKWTLNHQGPGSGLTELMPNTGVYVSEDEFFQCKQLGKNMRTYARLLLPLIFTKEALSMCSYTGKLSRSKVMKPGLDKHARNVLIDHLEKHAKESDWTIVSRKVLIQILGNKLRSILNKNLRNRGSCTY